MKKDMNRVITMGFIIFLGICFLAIAATGVIGSINNIITG